jgi:hypothetical protein
MPELEELTTVLDRRSGQRRIRVTVGDERAEITVQHESNEALGDEAPNWRPVDHPPLTRPAQAGGSLRRGRPSFRCG